MKKTAEIVAIGEEKATADMVLARMPLDEVWRITRRTKHLDVRAAGLHLILRQDFERIPEADHELIQALGNVLHWLGQTVDLVEERATKG